MLQIQIQIQRYSIQIQRSLPLLAPSSPIYNKSSLFLIPISTLMKINNLTTLFVHEREIKNNGSGKGKRTDC